MKHARYKYNKPARMTLGRQGMMKIQMQEPRTKNQEPNKGNKNLKSWNIRYFGIWNLGLGSF